MAFALKQLNVDCEPGAVGHIYENDEADPIAAVWRGYSGETYLDAQAWLTANDLRTIADMLDTIN